MVRAVLAINSDFAIQRREAGEWVTLTRVGTIDQASNLIASLNQPIHHTSIALKRGKRVKARGGI